MDAVLFSRGITRFNTQASSESITDDEDDKSSDLDLSDLLKDEYRQDHDVRRDSLSETRVSNSSEGSISEIPDNKPYSNKNLQVLLDSIDMHAKKLGMRRSDFLSRVESIIRTDRMNDDSKFTQYDGSDYSDSDSTRSGETLYSFNGIIERMGRVFQCMDRSNPKCDKITLFQKPSSYSILDNRCDDRYPTKMDDLLTDRPESIHENTETLDDVTPQAVETENQKNETQTDTTHFTTNACTNMIPTFTQHVDGDVEQNFMGRSLLSLSSSSSLYSVTSVFTRDNDESVPVLKTGGSFISYSTEDVTLKTRNDFNADSTLVSSMSYFDHSMDNGIPPVQQKTDAAVAKAKPDQTIVESGKRRKGFWASLFRRSHRRRGSK